MGISTPASDSLIPERNMALKCSHRLASMALRACTGRFSTMNVTSENSSSFTSSFMSWR